MGLSIRLLVDTDYDDYLFDWWESWKWTAPPRDFLPNNGTGGMIVFDDDVPVCAGFLYTTNSSVAWVDWIISSRTHKHNRKDALKLLISVLTEAVKRTGRKYSYATLKHQGLMDVYESLGYIKGDSNSTEMIKIL